MIEYTLFKGLGSNAFGWIGKYTDIKQFPPELRGIAKYLSRHPEVVDIRIANDDGTYKIIQRRQPDMGPHHGDNL